MDKYIYKISFDYSYALADISRQKGDVSSLDLFDNTPELIHKFDYDWITTDSNIIPDLIVIMSKILGLSMKSYEFVASILYNSNIDFIDIKLSDIQFKILTSIPLIKNSLNIKKSKITRFSSGDIMSIETPVFIPMNYPMLFKIEESPTSFFCSELLFNTIKENALRGWKFKECLIKKNKWL